MVAGVSPVPGDDIAIRLAEAMAELEPRVLLIDADLRHEGAAAGALVADGGLTAVLRGESSFDDELLLATYGEGDGDRPARTWSLLAAGRGSSRPLALLGSPQMDAVVAEASVRSDFVILAVPSVTSGADVLALAPLCHEIVLVVRERTVTREHAAAARDVLGAARASVLGIVLERRGRGRARWTLRRRRTPAAAPSRGARAAQHREAV
jgi:Mrp family chromosome partitioning ATPase